MKVLNFGSLNYDYTYRVSHMVRPGETLASENLQTHCGGKGLNQSIALARAGVSVFHAGMAGEDGGRLLEVCRQERIRTDFIRNCEGKSGHAVIQVTPSGENCILLYGGANRKNSLEHIENVLRSFGEGDILLLQNEINLVDELIERAFRKKMKIVLNPSPFEEKLLDYGLERVDTFLINETEGRQMSGEKTPEKILERLRQTYPQSEIVLTLGEKGVCLGGREETVSVPAFCVKAVDTTAAGDTFTGYYLAGVLHGCGKKESLRRACAASALAVMKKGAADSIPRTPDVDLFLDKGCGGV